MKISILTYGSRGDVQPYVAIGTRLQQAGHQVYMPTPDMFKPLITDAGLHHQPVNSIGPHEFMHDPAIKAAAETGSQLRILAATLRRAPKILYTIFEDAWQATADTDFVIASSIPFGFVDSAIARGLPWLYAPLHPLYPTRAFPSPVTAPFGFRLNSRLNPLTFTLTRTMFALAFGGTLNRWRRDHNLPPINRFTYYRWLDQHAHYPTLYGFSPTILGHPTDWPANHRPTGYWFYDPPGWTPPPQLLDFLDAGPPPICIGFGSMDDQNPDRINKIILDALGQTGHRAIILSGWSTIGQNTPLPDTILRLDSAPHNWLFPRVAAVVHHGGAGTTAATLRAGTPSLILPFAMDQPYWADRVTQLGIGLRGPSFFKVTPHDLATALTELTTNPRYAQTGAHIRQQLAAEDGPAAILQTINAHPIKNQ
ncbi:MAG TPA: glycosyltransferase [Anaerolineae bacterium]|nr:glycosyltransferase [Anaerolineae bacterium]